MQTRLEVARQHFHRAFDAYVEAARVLHEAEAEITRAEWAVYKQEQLDSNWKIMEREAAIRHSRRGMIR